MPTKHTASHSPRVRHHNSKGSLHTLEDLKEDIDSLQSHIAGLAKEIKSVSVHKAEDAAGFINGYVSRGIDSLKNSGTEAIESVEEGIRAKPAQSVMIAFAAGALVNYLFTRRW